MSAKLAKRADLSKKSARENAGQNPQECGWFAPIAQELKAIFGRKCAGEVSFRSGADISNVERWLAGKTAPSGTALARLLRSDIGDRVHDALIAGVQAPWAKNHRTVREIARLRQQQAEAARRLAALEGNIEG
jgi:hypothetical protein